MEVAKVRITKCDVGTYWYFGLVGHVFEMYRDGVDREGFKKYILKEDYDRGGGAYWRHISEPDCEEVAEAVPCV